MALEIILREQKPEMNIRTPYFKHFVILKFIMQFYVKKINEQRIPYQSHHSH